MGTLPLLVHLGIALAGAPLYTLLALRLHSGRGRPVPFERAAGTRRRILRTSAQIELFLVYSFLLLGDEYAPFRAAAAPWGRAALAAAFTAAILAAYLLGAWSRAVVDRGIRRIEGGSGSLLRFHVLLLLLRMGVFILATPLFFVRICDLDLAPWAPRNLLGLASVSLFFFLYVIRGPNVLLPALGMLRPFPDGALEEDVRREARRRGITVRGIRVLNTSKGRFAGAFAHLGSSQIFVTDHLGEVVDGDELRAVLYHEVGHLGQLKASIVQVLGSYFVFLVYVYLKYVIEATSHRRIGFETLIPGFLVLGLAVLAARFLFARIIRDGEVQADLFSAEIVGGRRPYHHAIAKVLLANGLPTRFTPSARETIPSGARLEEELL